MSFKEFETDFVTALNKKTFQMRVIVPNRVFHMHL